MRFVELMLLRVIMWVGIPLLLVVLAVGPVRLRRALHRMHQWLFERRLDPQEVLTSVIRQQKEHVAALIQALAEAQAIEREIADNIHQSEKNVASLEKEAGDRLGRGDDLGVRAALCKLNMEKQAIENFQHHRERQQRHIGDARRRLYQIELQLRQYEVGRTILLSQLAEARTVEQQLAIASHFDPFSAIANWEKAQGIVQEKSLNARAVEQVYADTPELTAGVAAAIDPVDLERQLADLKRQLPEGNGQNSHGLHGSHG